MFSFSQRWNSSSMFSDIVDTDQQKGALNFEV